MDAPARTRGSCPPAGPRTSRASPGPAAKPPTGSWQPAVTGVCPQHRLSRPYGPCDRERREPVDIPRDDARPPPGVVSITPRSDLMTNAISMDGLTKHYKDVNALTDLTLDVPSGTV